MVATGPAMAQEEPAPEAWQAVITEQVEALRHGDAHAALGLADARLQHSFGAPAQFVEAIKAWGYAPIVESRAHSFGRYLMVSPEEVVQDVRFVGGDQGLFGARYFVGLEGGVWRVHRVGRLVRIPGIGV
jgi:hypothetical protein